jgi:hypothetical protein
LIEPRTLGDYFECMKISSEEKINPKHTKRGQRAEGRGQRAEGRGQRAEGRG